jgi:hypothetical protein
VGRAPAHWAPAGWVPGHVGDRSPTVLRKPAGVENVQADGEGSAKALRKRVCSPAGPRLGRATPWLATRWCTGPRARRQGTGRQATSVGCCSVARPNTGQRVHDLSVGPQLPRRCLQSRGQRAQGLSSR